MGGAEVRGGAAVSEEARLLAGCSRSEGCRAAGDGERDRAAAAIMMAARASLSTSLCLSLALLTYSCSRNVACIIIIMAMWGEAGLMPATCDNSRQQQTPQEAANERECTGTPKQAVERRHTRCHKRPPLAMTTTHQGKHLDDEAVGGHEDDIREAAAVGADERAGVPPELEQAVDRRVF